MTGRRFLSGAILVASLVASLVALACCNRAPPKILDSDFPNLRQLHILSEVFDSNGDYKLAEELIDLDSGKAAYSETKEGIRTSWLLDVDETTLHRWLPFSCEKYDLKWLDVQSQARMPPVYDSSAKPLIKLTEGKFMTLYGISALVQNFHEVTYWKYSKIAQHGEPDAHCWSLTNVNNGRTIQLFLSEETSDDDGTTVTDFVLNSIEILEAAHKTTIKILSINNQIDAENRKKLELPLIYGCRRNEMLNDEMRRKFEIISAHQSNRYHLKGQLRMINFTGANPTSSEQTNMELAISNSNHATHKRLLMVRVQNSFHNVKTLMDLSSGLILEAHLNEGGDCSKQRINALSSIQALSPFSDELRVTAKTLEAMLYEVRPENFIKLELAHNEHAYFAQDFPGVLGPGKEARVVRKFSFDPENGRTKLDSVAIWVFSVSSANVWSIFQVFEFDFVENKPLLSDADNAQAFDMSKECYLDNREMIYGRDYVWATLTYQSDRLDQLRSKAETLKDAFYQRIRATTNLNFLRVPKMEIIFDDENERSFKLRMLILEALAPHLIYKQVERHTLDPNDVESSAIVESLEECSALCRRHKCTAMTFPGPVSNTCSIATRKIGELKPCEGAISYLAETRELELSELGLDEAAASVEQSSGQQNLAGILGIDDLTQTHSAAEGSNKLRHLSVHLRLNGRFLELRPTSLQIEAVSRSVEHVVELTTSSADDEENGNEQWSRLKYSPS